MATSHEIVQRSCLTVAEGRFPTSVPVLPAAMSPTHPLFGRVTLEGACTERQLQGIVFGVGLCRDHKSRTWDVQPVKKSELE